ncbi:hypothetical protein HDU96_010438 [Phlyctochytrium bullatum]|nr:hypothetical protein HDU96_010438 [Phlyctochytrium bullatum]
MGDRDHSAPGFQNSTLTLLDEPFELRPNVTSDALKCMITIRQSLSRSPTNPETSRCPSPLTVKSTFLDIFGFDMDPEHRGYKHWTPPAAIDLVSDVCEQHYRGLWVDRDRALHKTLFQTSTLYREWLQFNDDHSLRPTLPRLTWTEFQLMFASRATKVALEEAISWIQYPPDHNDADGPARPWALPFDFLTGPKRTALPSHYILAMESVLKRIQSRGKARRRTLEADIWPKLGPGDNEAIAAKGSEKKAKPMHVKTCAGSIDAVGKLETDTDDGKMGDVQAPKTPGGLKSRWSFLSAKASRSAGIETTTFKEWLRGLTMSEQQKKKEAPKESMAWMEEEVREYVPVPCPSSSGSPSHCFRLNEARNVCDENRVA